MRGAWLLVLLGCVLGGPAGATGFTFGEAERITEQRATAGSVAIGDANGDGLMDLAVMEDKEGWTHWIKLHLQQPGGSLAPPVTLSVPNDFGWSFPLVFADLDRDGTDELLVGTSKYLLVLRVAGGGLAVTVSREARYGCDYMATGDIDGDGHIDVACHSSRGVPTSASIFHGDGRGSFSRGYDMLTGLGTYGDLPDFIDLQLADVTGDGLVDFIVTASRVDHFMVFPNDGTGSISPEGTAYQHPRAPTETWASALEVVDIDGDGVNEVLTASPDNQPYARLNVYRLGDDGTLVLSERVPIHDSTTALLSADIDGDGDLELLAGHYLYHEVTVFGADSVGIASQARFELPGFGNTFESHSFFTPRLVGQSKALALGDLDNDGCVDLAAATFTGVTVLRGCQPSKRNVPASDVDGDGFGDLLWRNDVTQEFSLWRWADVRSWYACVAPCPSYKGVPWRWEAVGDFDGDGTSDVFWRNTRTGENVVMLTSMWDVRLTTVLDQDWEVVAAGDFDGDDRSDLFWRHRRTGANAIWPAGDFSRRIPTTGVTDTRWRVVGVGDFNGDGKSDVLWRHVTTGGNAIWLSGSYHSQQPIVGVTDVNWHVQGVGDFDGDGKDDIAWRKVDTGRNTIWLAGDYARQQAVTGVTNADWSIAAVADYDGDGRDDLMWRNMRTGANAIWGAASYQNLRNLPQMDPVMSIVK